MNALIKVAPGEAYLAYSKGALVFVALSELIGEDCLNRALQRFLQKNRYPNARPTARDLLHEILEISDSAHHTRIRSLFY
jgi:aminopeptidase N